MDFWEGEMRVDCGYGLHAFQYEVSFDFLISTSSILSSLIKLLYSSNSFDLTIIKPVCKNDEVWMHDDPHHPRFKHSMSTKFHPTTHTHISHKSGDQKSGDPPR